MKKIWQKDDALKSGSELDSVTEFVEAFTVGNDYVLDQKLLPFDVKASKVHARSLEKAGLLTGDEAELLCNGLDRILLLWEKGDFAIGRSQEDVHTAIEAWLTENLGEAGAKIHTGRSRNDQVLTAMRLYELDQLEKVKEKSTALVRVLLDFADAHEGVPMPGYTHTRKAMLSGVSQWAAGYAELLIAQTQFLDGIKTLISRSPLGTAAGFGSTIDLDREAQANELGFDTVLVSATSAQLSRGWMEQQLVSALCGFSALLARMSADVIRYSSEHYSYFKLDDAVCTGSSIMPQKKNPDLAELIRGRHSVMLSQQSTLMHLTQNLESGYHRDLQLSKEPVMLAFENLLEMLEGSAILVQHCGPNPEALEAACTPELFAAEYANLLVKHDGLSFRDAYKKAAKAFSAEGGIDSNLRKKLNPAAMMKEYTQLGSPGNPGIGLLRSQIKF